MESSPNRSSGRGGNEVFPVSSDFIFDFDGNNEIDNGFESLN